MVSIRNDKKPIPSMPAQKMENAIGGGLGMNWKTGSKSASKVESSGQVRFEGMSLW
jgi:hypothetical protein